MMIGRLHLRPGRTAAALAIMLGTTVLVAACNEQQSAQQPPPPPPVTVATPLVKRITEWDEFTGRFEATASGRGARPRLRLPAGSEFRRRRDGRRKATCSSSSIRAPTRRRSTRRRRISPAPRPGSTGRPPTRARARRWSKARRYRRRRYDERLQERRAAEAAVQQATAALQAAQLNLDFTEVRAPISGRVSDRRVDIGNLVTGDPNATLLTTIVALDPIYFAFDMSEARFPRLSARRRRAARFPRPATTRRSSQARLPDEEDWPYSGTMNFVDNRIEPGSGTIRARADAARTRTCSSRPASSGGCACRARTTTRRSSSPTAPS